MNNGVVCALKESVLGHIRRITEDGTYQFDREDRADLARLRSPFQPIFEPASARRSGGRKKRITQEEMIWRLILSDALKGDFAAAREILSFMIANEKARAAYGLPGKISTPSEAAPSNAFEALLLLGIVSVQGDRDSWSLHLEPWAVECAIDRLSPADYNDDLPRMREHLSPTEDSGSRSSLKAVVLAQLRKRRQPGATWFKKGKSGNPRGRPPKVKYELPYPFLEETLMAPIDGKEKKITVGEFLIRKLYSQAIKGDKKVRRLLVKSFGIVFEEQNTVLNRRMSFLRV